MEYIIVTVPGKEDADIDVLINKEKNGKIDETIILGSSGYAIISVDLPEAGEVTVDIKNTTANNPMVIKVTV